MANTDEALLTALSVVVDQELNRSIVELGLVKAATVVGDQAQVLLAFPTDAYIGADELVNAVRHAALSVDGIDGVDVATEVLSDAERAALRAQLIGDPVETAGSQPAQGHAEGRAIPFADPASKTRVLLIASGKGGVGKSSITANLSISLSRLDRRVAVIDADVWGFSIPRMLGVERGPTVIDQMMVPVEANDVRCISMGFFAREDEPVIWRGPMLHKALEQFLTDVFWDDPDYLLIDLPPGTGDISLSLSQFLPRSEVFVVTTPQPAAQKVAQRAAFMAQKVNLPVRGVIENMSWFTADDGARYDIFGSGGGQELADQLDVRLLANVPLVPALREGADTGAPIVVSDPDSEVSKVFAEMARVIDEELPPSRRYHPELKLL